VSPGFKRGSPDHNGNCQVILRLSDHRTLRWYTPNAGPSTFDAVQRAPRAQNAHRTRPPIGQRTHPGVRCIHACEYELTLCSIIASGDTSSIRCCCATVVSDGEVSDAPMRRVTRTEDRRTHRTRPVDNPSVQCSVQCTFSCRF
jgi:hypothetical protein